MPVNDHVTAPASDGTGPIPAAGAVTAEERAESAVPGRPRGRLRSVAGLVAAHRPFCLVLIGAALLRIVVMLGYPPAMFFNDSYNYMTDAWTKSPDAVRSDGYPLFLYLMLPFHSLNLVTGLQALMGLMMGVGIYAVLRRRGLPWWGATIPALPVLFDVFELQLEHMVAADLLFYTLVTLALVLLCWWDRPPLAVAVLVGLATGYATTVRSVGEPLLVLIVVGMLVRRMGWRRIAATAVAGLLPIVAYMAWFHSFTGHYALDESTGTFLYSRVQSFADCDRMNPPTDLRVLCDPRALADRPISQEYLWSNDTPLATLTGPNNANRFTPAVESLTMKYAKLAIESQPLDYAKVVAEDALRPFGWTRDGVNDTTSTSAGNVEGSGSKFRFEYAAEESSIEAAPGWVTTDRANAHAARAFGGANYGQTSVVQPWSDILRTYQKVVYLRGPFLLLFLLAGAVGVILGIRRKTRVPGTGWGGLSLLPWLVGVALLVLPAMTAGFSYRYVLAAIPPLCLAAGLAFAARGSLITWLRERRRAGRAARVVTHPGDEAATRPRRG
jgi:hypothetical protein